MSDPIIDAAEAEEKRILAEIENSPLYRRLQTVQTVLAILRANTAPITPPKSRVVSAVGRAGGIRSKRQEIEDVVESYLLDSGRRASSGELFQAVSKAGIEIGGAVPSKALASTLSTSDRFNNIRELGGYGLVRWGDTAGPAVEETKGLIDYASNGPSQVTGEPDRSPIETQTNESSNG